MRTEKQRANDERLRAYWNTPEGRAIRAEGAARGSAAAKAAHDRRGRTEAQTTAARANSAKAREAQGPEARRDNLRKGNATVWERFRREGPTEAQRAAWRANGLRLAERNRTPEMREHLRTVSRKVIGECVYDGAPATGLDHAIPRGRPGWDDPGNLVPACTKCNASKSARSPEEWLEAGLHGAPPIAAVIP